jgi:ribosomal protein L40E
MSNMQGNSQQQRQSLVKKQVDKTSTHESQQICPKCGAANSLSADICQSCKTWLLDGKCKFCYADLSSDEAKFCPECGKPQDGIPCPSCGNLSIFDFCTKCGKPVTEEAVAEMQAAQAQVNVEPEMEIEIEEDEPEVIEEEPIRKSLFSERQIASIMQKGADIDEANRQRAEAKRIAEEEERQRQIREEQAKKEALRIKKEQQRLAAIAARKATIEESKQNAKKRFNNQQQARRWHLAWHNTHPGAIGWLCNYSGTVHLYSNGGPNDCADASQGGCDYFGNI